jgi:hypothetical protein
MNYWVPQLSKDRKRKTIPEISGSWDIPPVWFALAFMLPGVGAVLYGIYRILSWPFTGQPPDAQSLFMILWGMGFGGGGYALWFIRRKLLRLAALEDLSEQAGISPGELGDKLDRLNITAQYRVNGRLYYDPKDLDGVATLLRPATADDNALLRSAESKTVESERLLRAESVDAPAGERVELRQDAVSKSDGLEFRQTPRKTGFVPLLLFGIGAVAVVALAFFLIVAALIAGIALMGGALAIFGYRRATGSLATAQELARRAGITPRDMDRILEERQIHPRFILNGQAMYDSRAIKNPEKLLRTTGGPIIDAEPVLPSESAAPVTEHPLLAKDSANSGPVIDVEESNSAPHRAAPD